MTNESPVDLKESLNEEITVHLKGNQKLKGTLLEWDKYMNLVLKKVGEYQGEKLVKKYELAVVKGGNVRKIKR